MKILVVSGLSSDSGCMLRARYLTEALRKAGADARLAKSMKALPLWLDWPLAAIWNLRLLFTRCDVVIGCKPLPTITPLLLLRKLAGAFVVIDIDDLDFAYRGGILSRILRAIEKPFPRRFDVVTYHNPRLEPAIREVFGVVSERMIRLPQGVDCDVFARGGERARLRPDCKWVVYPGHLNSASDLGAVFEVIRAASQRLPEIRLLVVGGGPDESRFRRLAITKGIDGIAEFAGQVTPEEVAKYLRAADAGMAYYKDEPANYYRESMKVREMLAMGLRVITTDVGELRQFSQLTYQAPAVPEQAANVLVRLLQTGGDGRESAGPAFIRVEMDWSRLGQEFLNVLIPAVSGRRSPLETTYE